MLMFSYYLSQKFKRETALQWFREEFDSFKPKKILDLGCQYGDMVAGLRKRYAGSDVFGFDCELGDLNKALERKNIESGKAIHGDIKSLSSKEEFEKNKPVYLRKPVPNKNYNILKECEYSDLKKRYDLVTSIDVEPGPFDLDDWAYIQENNIETDPIPIEIASIPVIDDGYLFYSVAAIDNYFKASSNPDGEAKRIEKLMRKEAEGNGLEVIRSGAVGTLLRETEQDVGMLCRKL